MLCCDGAWRWSQFNHGIHPQIWLNVKFFRASRGFSGPHNVLKFKKVTFGFLRKSGKGIFTPLGAILKPAKTADRCVPPLQASDSPPKEIGAQLQSPSDSLRGQLSRISLSMTFGISRILRTELLWIARPHLYCV